MKYCTWCSNEIPESDHNYRYPDSGVMMRLENFSYSLGIMPYHDTDTGTLEVPRLHDKCRKDIINTILQSRS